MRKIISYSLAAVATAFLAACDYNQIVVEHAHPVQHHVVVVDSQPAPPPLRVEVVGHAPYAHATWYHGHWYWTHHHYVWVHGYWR
jgi:hypothetical protein